MHVIVCENICVIKLLERDETDYLEGVFHTLAHPPVYILQVTMDTSVTGYACNQMNTDNKCSCCKAEPDPFELFF